MNSNQPEQFKPAETLDTSKLVEIQPTVEQHENLENVENKPSAEQVQKPTEKSDSPRTRLSFLKKTTRVIPQTKDEVTVKIEKIMESGLKDAYEQLSPIAQQEFKIKGEETANKIRELMRSAHLKVKKVFQLIYEWLRLLPGINKFFLEQEAKIKTDKIIAVKKSGEEAKIEGI